MRKLTNCKKISGVEFVTLHANGATLHPNVATSGPNVATLGPNVATSDVNVATSFPLRMKKEQLYNAIADYCTEWRTALEIALYVGRDIRYIRNHVLPGMTNKLQRLFPKENHPGQKYKVKEQ